VGGLLRLDIGGFLIEILINKKLSEEIPINVEKKANRS
jgi:hypothetical protein